MYNRIYNFFINNDLVDPLQFGFRQKYSTVHALINFTENILRYLDEYNVGSGIFVD